MGLGKVFKVENPEGPAVGGRNLPFGVVPNPIAESTALVRTVHPAIALREETIRVATRLRMSITDSEQTIAFTGPTGADLASELAQDAALAFSQFSPGQVLLVSASAASREHRRQEEGLAEVLTGRCLLQNALIEPADGGPWLLPAGHSDSERSHLYFSSECALLFGALGQRFRHILVDAGPLNIPASLVMIARCDTVAIVLAAGPHRKKEVRELQKELARVKTRVLGVVLSTSGGAERKSW